MPLRTWIQLEHARRPPGTSPQATWTCSVVERIMPQATRGADAAASRGVHECASPEQPDALGHPDRPRDNTERQTEVHNEPARRDDHGPDQGDPVHGSE